MESTGFIHMSLTNLAAVMVFMLLVWLLSLARRDASIVDIFWGLGFILVAWISFFLGEGQGTRNFLVATLTTLWGVRLSMHLFARNWGHAEDRRYRSMRAAHGGRFWIVSLFTVFFLQGGILWTVSLVIQAIQHGGGPSQVTWLDALGLFVWTTGFLFETAADRQLARFKSQPHNQDKVMSHGLWAYSRHPNYFGETLIWWGLYLMALSQWNNAWVVVSPLLMTILLLRVSGVTLLENTMEERRPQYARYKRRTNAFVPWFPKKDTP